MAEGLISPAPERSQYATKGEWCSCCDREAHPLRPLILSDKGYVCAHDDFCRAGTNRAR